MAVEVRILETQHETLVMELDRLKTGSRVCGMLCGLGYCSIIEVTHLQEVKREEHYICVLYAWTVTQQKDKHRYIFLN
jgi:hypothetical protein